MADRNPSDFNRWLNEQAMDRGDPIVLTVPDLVFDDLQYLRDSPRLLESACFLPKTETGGVAAEKFRIRIHNKDLGGTGAATTPVSWTARLKVSGGATATLTLDDGTTTDTVAITSASETWCAVQTGYTLQTNGTAVNLLVKLHISAGAGTASLDGILIYAAAT